MAPPPSEQLRLAARVRAAIAYSGLRTDEIAQRTGDDLGVATLRRITSISRPRGATLEELWRIADACQVPRSWLERGEWTDASVIGPTKVFLGHGSSEERLEVVERYLELMLSRLEGGPGGLLPAAPPVPPKRQRRVQTSPASRSAPRARTSSGDDFSA